MPKIMAFFSPKTLKNRAITSPSARREASSSLTSTRITTVLEGAKLLIMQLLMPIVVDVVSVRADDFFGTSGRDRIDGT